MINKSNNNLIFKKIIFALKTLDQTDQITGNTTAGLWTALFLQISVMYDFYVRQ